MEIIDLLNKENRQDLIRKSLEHPRVSMRRCNAPTIAALIDNVIYAVGEALKEIPANHSLYAAYAALQVEYPLHFTFKTEKYWN